MNLWVNPFVPRRNLSEMDKVHQEPGKSNSRLRQPAEMSTSFSKRKPLARGIPESSTASGEKPFTKKQPVQGSENPRRASEVFKKKQTSDDKKKPFDKKKWRMQRYNNKFKVQQWEEKRKKAMTRRYERDMKKDADPKFDVKKLYEQEASEEESSENEDVQDNKRRKKINKRASLEERQEQYKKMKIEKEAALRKYQEEKAKNAKRLSQRTKKGQPVMKGRLEMLLERIQKNLQ